MLAVRGAALLRAAAAIVVMLGLSGCYVWSEVNLGIEAGLEERPADNFFGPDDVYLRNEDSSATATQLLVARSEEDGPLRIHLFSAGSNPTHEIIRFNTIYRARDLPRGHYVSVRSINQAPGGFEHRVFAYHGREEGFSLMIDDGRADRYPDLVRIARNAIERDGLQRYRVIERDEFIRLYGHWERDMREFALNPN